MEMLFLSFMQGLILSIARSPERASRLLSEGLIINLNKLKDTSTEVFQMKKRIGESNSCLRNTRKKKKFSNFLTSKSMLKSLLGT